MLHTAAKTIQRARSDAADIYFSGIDAVSPGRAIRRHCRLENNLFSIGTRIHDLSEVDQLYIIGAGKACAPMARALEEMLGDRISGGLINVKYHHTLPLARITANEAGHPIPDQAGLDGARKILEIVSAAKENDLILCLISGGGSALLPVPADGITLPDKQKTAKQLVACGADIHEINIIRKHMSAIKGGKLARAAWPAAVSTLILSDVVGDDPSDIASGPTSPDASSFQDCLDIIDFYGIRNELPESVICHLEQGVDSHGEPVVPSDDPIFKNVRHTIIGNNYMALAAAREKAVERGYNTLLLSSGIAGDTVQAAHFHADIAGEIRKSGNPVAPPACILSGGETTVRIAGTGKGGRNMEYALAFSLAASNLPGFVLLSAGTDGTDGPTDSAGAYTDSMIFERAARYGLKAFDYLSNNDSYHFFQKTGDLFSTGPTLTNVMDLRIMILI